MSLAHLLTSALTEAKKGTPPGWVTRLHQATNICLSDTTYLERMTAMNVGLASSKPSDVQIHAQRDIAVWRPLIDQHAIHIAALAGKSA